ncbi:hypothetical protein BU16DRAFT_531136 [Lophium mytilinum]|uniref:Uncharacterized protein n=1 Tax=Lophium mytilinum TaxID=390894 RepID=A0A6A6QBZ3_9PEZI|nr:hypothetical protein BU16DRAFT_531136 [Lophium mytilinum]
MASRTNGNPTDLLRLQQQPSRPTSGPGLLSWGDVAYCYTEATVIIAAIAYFAKPTITHCDNFIVLLGETTRLLIQLMILRWSPLAIWTSSYPFIRIIYYLGRFLCVGGTTHEAESDPIVYRFGAIRPSSSTGLISFYLNTAEGNARLFAFFAGSACSILRMMWEKDVSSS